MKVAAQAVPAVASLGVFTALSLIVVSLRLYTRLVVVKNPGADDVLMVGSVIIAIAFLSVLLVQIRYGLGRRVTLDELDSFLMALWGTIPLYNAALSLCKLSIAVQYYRVFRTATMQRIMKAILVVLVIYSLWSVLGTILTCVPVQKWWRPTIEGTCLDRNAITYVNAGFNIVTDLVLLAVPIPLLHKLQIPRKQKFILVGVFTCGGLACAMSIIRIHSLYQIGIAPPSMRSVEGVNIAIWSGIEVNVGIICASVPALKALGVRIIPKLLLSSLYVRSRTPGGGRYIKQKNVSGSGHPSTSVPDVSYTETAASANHRITIQQSFEMNAINLEQAAIKGGTRREREGGQEVSCYAPAVLRGAEP